MIRQAGRGRRRSRAVGVLVARSCGRPDDGMSKSPQHIAFIAANYPSPATRPAALRGAVCSSRRPRRQEMHRDLSRADPRMGRGTAGFSSVRGRSGARQRLATVFRPLYVSLSSKRLGPVNTFAATQLFFQRAAGRGAAARPQAGRRLRAFSLLRRGRGRANRQANGHSLVRGRGRRNVLVRAALRVQPRPRRFPKRGGSPRRLQRAATALSAELEIPERKIGVFPNGIDPELFYPRNRAEMRSKHGLPPDVFIVAYVGNFLAEKGVAQAAAAIADLDGVGGVFLGTGPLAPAGPGVLLRKTVAHQAVAELLAPPTCSSCRPRWRDRATPPSRRWRAVCP